jgi:hypothetical protein
VRKVGKLLQIAGLVILPCAILMELSGDLGRRSGVSEMLLLMIAGASLFYIGRIVEGYAGRS